MTLNVSNALDEDTSIHWHGILLPANMDGVPGLSVSGIHPGQAYRYQFAVKQHGTYWYQSHSGFQEQQGVYGPLVIDPREPDAVAFDREHVVMLTDWTDERPGRVFKKLKKQSDYYNFRQRTLTTFIRDVKDHGLSATLAERRMWGEMRMSAADLADITGYTYTYLMNGRAPGGNWTGLFAPGEKVRLRFINGSAMTYFDVRIPGLKMTVVAADGLPVRPVSVDEFRIAVVSTFDDPDGREPSRTIELHLTGHMERFAWSFDGIKFSGADPVRLTYGERVRIVLVNDTMMTHPIHLHGMWSDLEDDEGRFKVRKHTIDMPPGTRRSYRVTADALGRWAYHCHLLFHMEAGMFREVRVEEGQPS